MKIKKPLPPMAVGKSGNHYNGCNDTFQMQEYCITTLVIFQLIYYKGFLHPFLRKGVLLCQLQR